MKKIFNLVWGISIAALSVVSSTFAYTQEEQEAYEWAYQYGITTQPTIEAANLDGNITRQAFAKMVVNYLEKVVLLEESTSNSCSFPDESKITNDLIPYAKKTCSYGIMWKDWTKFNPTQPLDKAQLWTVLSRILWWDEYNNTWKWYYIYHLNALKFNWIMDNIDNPTEWYVRRWDVLVMLKRIYEKFSPDSTVNKNQPSTGNIGNKPINKNETKDVILDWEHIVYYDNGKVAVKMNFKNGEKDWIQESYYENGQLQTKENYKEWKLDGEQVNYYEDGQLKSKWSFKDDKPIWELVSYYEDGQLEGKWSFKDGKTDWEFIYYYKNGQIEEKHSFKNWINI